MKIKKNTIDRFIKISKGSISVLLSVIMTGILSLSALLVEAARYEEAKKQLEEATISSTLSILAQLDSDLESRFGLFGIDSETLKDDSFMDYLLFNSDESDIDEYKSNDISKLYNITSGKSELKYDLANYQVIKRQLLEYEKYRAPLNMASDLLDIDKMIKKLVENIEKMVPGLEKMLKVLDSLVDIVEALKQLYCLYKDIEQLQLTINNNGEDNSIGEDINNVLGKGWNLVESLFSDKEWPSYDPSYIVAYNKFKDAVNKKVNYIKSHPRPADPGPKPTDDVEGLKSEFEQALSKYDNASILLKLTNRAIQLGYYDGNGIVESSKKIDDILDTDISTSDLSKFSLSTNSTRQQLSNVIKSNIDDVFNVYNYLTDFKNSSMSAMSSQLSAKVSELSTDYNQKKTAYNNANSKMNDWNKKNQELIEYNTNMTQFSEEFQSTKKDLLGVINVVSEELNSYKASFTKLTSAIDKATDAIETIRDLRATKKDKEPNIFTMIKNEFIVKEESKPINGINFLNNQKKKLGDLLFDDITSSYVFENEFNTGDLLHDSSYYMTKKQATDLCVTLASTDLLDKSTKIFDIIKALWKLYNILKPYPSMYNFDCLVKLNSSTTDLLPSKINDGRGTFEASNTKDISDITELINDAKSKVNSGYISDINSVDPNNRIEQSEYNAELSARISRLSTNLGKLLGNSYMSSLMGGSWLLVSTIINLFNIVDILRQIIDDFIYIAKHIKDAVLLIIKSLGESILLNQYAVEKFPNRTTQKELKGYFGDHHTFFPDNNKKVQTFSGAQTEYIIGGSYDEKANQITCFWSIFVIRAINNMVAVLEDETAMGLIDACNIAAPLVYILWVYLESNIDMNMLVSGMKVPLIKTKIILSPNTLMTELDKLITAFEDIDEEKAIDEELSYAAMKVDNINQELFSVDGIFEDMKYKDYLWFFLCFVPNQTKTMRIADLIQMEMRFKKQGKKGNFELKNLHSYVRSESEGAYNSILPVISLKNNSLNGRGIKMSCVKYVGY